MELEGEVEALKEGVRERDVVREGSTRESEAIVGALQGQVDAANKVCLCFMRAFCVFVLDGTIQLSFLTTCEASPFS